MRQRAPRLDSRGFSLIEVMVVMTLMALAATFVGGYVFKSLSEGRVKAAKVQMSSFRQQLDDYRRLCYNYPSTDQGLEALVSKPTSAPECPAYPEGGFMKKIPKDPWDTPYDYSSDGKTYRIRSFGNNKMEGGTGDDADISSDDL